MLRLDKMLEETRLVGHGVYVQVEYLRISLNKHWSVQIEHDNYFGDKSDLTDDMIDELIGKLEALKEIKGGDDE